MADLFSLRARTRASSKQSRAVAAAKAPLGCLVVSAALLTALTGMAKAASCDSVAGNLIVNCGAESGNTGWTFDGAGTFTGFPNSGLREFGMTGGGASPQSISQTVTLLNNSIYTLTFAYKPLSTGGTTIGLAASWNGQSLFSATANATAGFSSVTRNVTGTGAAGTLKFDFTSTDTSNGTYIVDDVTLKLMASSWQLQTNVSSNMNAAVTQSSTSSSQMNSLLTSASPDRVVVKSTVKAGYAAERSPSAKAAAAYAALDRAAGVSDPAQGNWEAWAAGFGNRSVLSDSASGNDVTSRGGGTAVGVEYKGAPDTVLGFALGAAGGNWSASDGTGDGKNNTFLLAAYARRSFGASYLAAAGNYGWNWTNTNRYQSGETFAARFTSTSYGGRIETGHRFAVARFGVTPYAAGQIQVVNLPGYSETVTSGLAENAMSYSSGRSVNTRTELGSLFDVVVPASRNIKLFSKAAWANDYHGNSNVSVNFLTQPGTGFVVNGSSMPRNLGLVSAGAEVALTETMTLTAKVDGEFARGYRGYAGTGSLRYVFN